MNSLTMIRDIINGNAAYLAPAVFNPLCAKLAEQAGFKVLYLGGGPLGYVKTVLEANLGLTETVQAGVEIRAACGLPLILDGTCGWGDPMHVGFTVRAAEAAGFCAIEIEDQVLPKRAHHHVGIEHMIPQEAMVAKVHEAVHARQDLDFVIIARTNGVRASSMDDALRRASAYREAGADVIYLSPRTAEEMRFVGERLGPPLMFSLPGDGLQSFGMSLDDAGALGFRLISVTTPTLWFHRAMKQGYEALAAGKPVPALAGTSRQAEQDALHETLDLEALLALERDTVESPPDRSVERDE
ncbi:MAG TPA: isocitrate lyase/PEP mutase family protein [Burkholderiales bacterium]|nr:isocitrate lyase/PEP mutase family protein [Burkholderiales bacterium]